MPAVSKAQQRYMGMVHAAQQGGKPASPEVAKTARGMSPKSADEFASTSHRGLPNHVKSESIGALIGRYNTFGERLSQNISLRELAEELTQIADAAEFAITNEQADDWYDAHTITRNVGEIRKYVKEVAKIAEDYDSLHVRAKALVDDCGHILQRYFEMNDITEMSDYIGSPKYDTGEDEIQPDNLPRKKVDPDVRDQMAKEPMEKDQTRFDETGEKFQHLTHQLAGKGAHDPKALAAYIGREKYGNKEFQHKAAAGHHEAAQHGNSEYHKQLAERLVALARHRLTGEQLTRFDTLPMETQIRAAWKIIR